MSTVSEIGEFGLIARVTEGLQPAPSTLLGTGDDAAVVAAGDGRVVVSTDLLVEHRHFRRDWSTGEDVGHKAAARAFSDIAAMGALPTALVIGFAVPGTLELSWVDGLMSGLRAECAVVEAAIVGGDVTAADRVDQRCTTGQVRVRVMPLTACTRATTSLPSSSMDSASARTMTS